MAAKNKMLTAVFRERKNAQAAYELLANMGYSSSEINVLMSDATRRQFDVGDRTEKVQAGTYGAEGVAAGGAVGTAVGATLAAILAIGAANVVLPGLGLLVAGPLAAGLVGAGAGAVAGGTLGGIIGSFIPESNAAAYEEALREGGVAIGVVPHNDADAERVQKQFERLAGENIVYA